jgi:thiol:disulfide interchange protein DsbD
MKWFLAIFLVLLNAVAAEPGHTKATLVLAESTAKPGSKVMAALHLKMDPHWHTYWRNGGDSGKATKIVWELPPGITAGEIAWPTPEKNDLEGLFTYIYENEVALLIPLTIDASAPNGPVKIKAKANWLECEKSCVPGRASVEADLVIGAETKPSPDAPRFAAWQDKIPKADPDLVLTARWDGPATAEERAIIFTINKTSGAWDFFNDPIEGVDLAGKTDALPAQEGKVAFRKVAKKYDGNWPTEITGLAIIPGAEKSARAVKATLGDVASAPAAAGTSAAAIEPAGPKANPTLIAILGLAFVGGLILNIMPCVLPVIALKILGFVKQSKEDPKRIRKLGLMYAVGVIASFMILAGFVIGIKQAGRAASWGMQFQNPQFLLGITILVTLVALNLFGVFEISVSGKAMDSAGSLASREGYSGAFFNGVLATILATPCTAPFLGAALGFAFASSTAVILLVFLFVALGLAAPYVVLCWFPAWLKKLPRPGDWMEKFKIAMGFPMLATAIWLFSLAANPAHYGKSAPLYLGLLLVMIGFAAWIFGEFVQRGTKRRGLATGFAAALVLAGAFVFASNTHAKSSDEIAWQPWTTQAVEAARAKGQAVMVDFTADWCLTCQVNKKTSIEIPAVREKIKALGIAPFLADNTRESPLITAELQKYQRAGVPLVLIFPADPKAPAIVLPEVLTPSIMLNALDKAAGR